MGISLSKSRCLLPITIGFLLSSPPDRKHAQITAFTCASTFGRSFGNHDEPLFELLDTAIRFLTISSLEVKFIYDTTRF